MNTRALVDHITVATCPGGAREVLEAFLGSSEASSGADWVPLVPFTIRARIYENKGQDFNGKTMGAP